MKLEGTIRHGFLLGVEEIGAIEGVLSRSDGLVIKLANCHCEELVIAFGPVGSYVDLSGYYTSAETDELLDLKANKADVYTIAQTDEIVQKIEAKLHFDDRPTRGSENAVMSGGVYTALQGKVDKVAGKGLSTNDFTNAYKTKLIGIEAGAEVNRIERIYLNGNLLEIENKNVNIPLATTTTAGAMSARDKRELAGKQDKLIPGRDMVITGNIISNEHIFFENSEIDDIWGIAELASV